jgi:hypothetical protein
MGNALYVWVRLRIEEATNIQSVVPTGTPSPIIVRAREAKVSVESHGIRYAYNLPV